MRYKTEVSEEWLLLHLAEGECGCSWKVEKGLPPGCRLVDVVLHNSVPVCLDLIWADSDDEEPIDIVVITRTSP